MSAISHKRTLGRGFGRHRKYLLNQISQKEIARAHQVEGVVDVYPVAGAVDHPRRIIAPGEAGEQVGQARGPST